MILGAYENNWDNIYDKTPHDHHCEIRALILIKFLSSNIMLWNMVLWL